MNIMLVVLASLLVILLVALAIEQDRWKYRRVTWKYEPIIPLGIILGCVVAFVGGVFGLLSPSDTTTSGLIALVLLALVSLVVTLFEIIVLAASVAYRTGREEKFDKLFNELAKRIQRKNK